MGAGHFCLPTIGLYALKTRFIHQTYVLWGLPGKRGVMVAICLEQIYNTVFVRAHKELFYLIHLPGMWGTKVHD